MGDSASVVRYCPSCGEEVLTYALEKMGVTARHCYECSLCLDWQAQDASPDLPAVYVVDDDPLMVAVLTDLLPAIGIARRVVAAESGPDFLQLATRHLRDGGTPGLVILDYMMAPVDGASAAFALRAIEQGFAASPPIPILFFSARRCDDRLRRAMAACQPALYLNKGQDLEGDRLTARLKELAGRLREMAFQGATAPIA
jgi:CheY-like chemotaxis protein